MQVIHIHRKIESETLYLPELRPLVGKNVELIVFEQADSVQGNGDWAAAAKAAEELRQSGYDFDAWQEQREYDLKHARDGLL